VAFERHPPAGEASRPEVAGSSTMAGA